MLWWRPCTFGGGGVVPSRPLTGHQHIPSANSLHCKHNNLLKKCFIHKVNPGIHSAETKRKESSIKKTSDEPHRAEEKHNYHNRYVQESLMPLLRRNITSARVRKALALNYSSKYCQMRGHVTAQLVCLFYETSLMDCICRYL